MCQLEEKCVEIAMMVTPDGHNRLEISRFLTPSVVEDHRNAPVNALGQTNQPVAMNEKDPEIRKIAIKKLN